MQNVPINNRRWSSLAMSTPGVVSDSNGFGLVSIRGISPILNNVEIDGADDNQAFFAEERGRTREAYSTSGNAVREFAVNTGVYSAEYGRAAGGVITSVTKSGTNRSTARPISTIVKATGTLSTTTRLFPVKSLHRRHTSQHIKPEDLRKIYGFTAGGALIKDKLFWIYTYDQHTHVFPEVGYSLQSRQLLYPACRRIAVRLHLLSHRLRHASCSALSKRLAQRRHALQKPKTPKPARWPHARESPMRRHPPTGLPLSTVARSTIGQRIWASTQTSARWHGLVSRKSIPRRSTGRSTPKMHLERPLSSAALGFAGRRPDRSCR